MADESRQAAAREKLYNFISDPANRNDPDLDIARELLASLPKTGLPERARPKSDLYGSRASDERAGVGSGPVQTKPYRFKLKPSQEEFASPEAGGPPEEAYLTAPEPGVSRTRADLRPDFARRNEGQYDVKDAFEDDIIAQTALSGPAGRAAGGAVAGPLSRVSPMLGKVGGGMAAGATEASILDADPRIGAALGGALPLVGGGLGLVADAILKSRAGQNASSALATLESAGQGMKPPAQQFGVPGASTTAVDALEAGADAANIAKAREALTFQKPNMHEGGLGALAAVAHAMHIPYAPPVLAALMAGSGLSRNAVPLIGRVGIPAGRVAAGVGSAAMESGIPQTLLQAGAAAAEKTPDQKMAEILMRGTNAVHE